MIAVDTSAIIAILMGEDDAAVLEDAHRAYRWFLTKSQAHLSREAFRHYGQRSGHAAALNFGDCFSYALAREEGAPLLYKGQDFTRTDVVSAV